MSADKPADPNAKIKATIRAALAKQAENHEKWAAERKAMAAERAEQERRFRARERLGLDAALASGLEDLTPEESLWLAASPARREDLARRLYTAHADLQLQIYREGSKIADGTATPEELARWHSEEGRKALDGARAAWSERVDAATNGRTRAEARVRDAVRRLWLTVLQLWNTERMLYPEEDESGNIPLPEEKQIKAALAGEGSFPSFAGALDLSDHEVPTGSVSEVEGAVLWPSVLDAWRREVWTPSRTAPASFRVPGALMSGRGMVAGFFGRRLAGKQSLLSKGGRISALRLDADRTQLELLSPNRKALTDPSPAEIFQAFGEILGNREWRTLQACFCAAHEDEASGSAPAPGKLWFTPARFAGLLGIPRESGGKGTLARVPKDSVRALDESVANLGRVKGTATFKVRGKDLELEFTDLVREDGVTLAERGHRRGRRPAVLYRLNEGLRALMESRIVNLPREALAAPLDPRTGKQVPQDVWDDAFKIFTLLAGHARSNAPRAKTDNPLPWTRKLDGLLTDANLAGAEVPARKVRARGLERLDDLARAGLVSFVVDGQGEEAMLRYDLPTVRPSLASIPGRKVVEALPASSSDKAPRKRRTPPGDKPTGRPPGRTGGA